MRERAALQSTPAPGVESRPATNVADLILGVAEQRPDHTALVVPRRWDDGEVVEEDVHTYGSLVDRAGQLAAGLQESGLRSGDRIVVLFPPDGDLFALVIGAVAAGLTVVVVDVGMGFSKARAALRTARPRAIVTTSRVLRLRRLVPELAGIPLAFVSDGNSKGRFPRTGRFPRLSDLAAEPAPLRPVARSHDDEALLTFTSGSTGAPKGVDKTHGVLAGQHTVLADVLPYRRDDVTMPMFTTFALHDLASGVTCVLPPISLRHPGQTRGRVVTSFANRHGVTVTIGSPAYIERIVDHTLEAADPIRSLRLLATGGAPVPARLCRRTEAAYPNTDCRVLYGSTEVEPIAGIAFADVSDDSVGHLVGKPFPQVGLAVVRIPDPAPRAGEADIDRWRCPAGIDGEIVVSGPHVVRRYVGSPTEQDRNKLVAAGGEVWHRTGDVGYLDQDGRLVLTGRARDVVDHGGSELRPLVVEAQIDAHPGVVKSALVAHAGAPEGELLVELAGEKHAAPREIESHLAEQGLADLPVVAVPAIPMDGRHNSKIDRPALRRQRTADAVAARLHLPPELVRHLPERALRYLAGRTLRTAA